MHAAGMDQTYGTYVDDACFVMTMMMTLVMILMIPTMILMVILIQMMLMMVGAEKENYKSDGMAVPRVLFFHILVVYNCFRPDVFRSFIVLLFFDFNAIFFNEQP